MCGDAGGVGSGLGPGQGQIGNQGNSPTGGNSVGTPGPAAGGKARGQISSDNLTSTGNPADALGVGYGNPVPGENMGINSVSPLAELQRSQESFNNFMNKVTPVTDLLSVLPIPLANVPDVAAKFGKNIGNLGFNLAEAITEAPGIAPPATGSDFGALGPGQGGGTMIQPEPINSGASSPPPGDTGATGGTSSTGGDGTSGGNNDPTTYSFWNDFVDEWLGKNGPSAKQQILADDAFRKAQLEPVISNYKNTLSNLQNEALTKTGVYTPVTFGMGDFRTSFVPKSGFLRASDVKDFGKANLANSLMLTDVMQPYRGSREYLDKLLSLAQWKAKIDQDLALALKGYKTQKDIGTYEPKDKGTWLDAIRDLVDVGNTVGDAIDKINKFWP